MTTLQRKDVLALGFMTFALFIGAGNIIFPPIVAQQAGTHVWLAGLGFLITAVGLPVLTIIALSRTQGSIEDISAPIGRAASLLLTVVCYLSVGPLFAIPRTATVSYEVGLASFFGESSTALFIYSLCYFALVTLISLYPNRLLDTVGYILAPLKIIALCILGIAAFIIPTGTIAPAVDHYIDSPLSEGFVSGYLTMDTLGALVFGIVIVNAIRSRGVSDPKLITHYASIAGLIAGAGLTLVYISLFKLGLGSHDIAPHAGNGAVILHAYVAHAFGPIGSSFLALLISLACMVTAVGLTCACAEYFQQFSTRLTYRRLVFILILFSWLVSNLGLTRLILFSEPVLTAIYPPAITVIVLSFFWKSWRRPAYVVAPVTLTALLFGITDGLKVAHLEQYLPTFLEHLPLQQQHLAWLMPAIVAMLICSLLDRFTGLKPH